VRRVGRLEPAEEQDAARAARGEEQRNLAGRRATTEVEYTEFRHRLTGTLSALDERLAGQRYLFGTGLTEADVRLWPTLARFDLGYNRSGKISERAAGGLSRAVGLRT